MNVKQVIAEKATEYIRTGMVVGLGTGSTANYAIKKIGELVRNGLQITGVPTSKSTEMLAIAERIPLMPVDKLTAIDLTIDGADEFDPDRNVIKGGGGALLREKVIASLTCHYIIIADASKQVQTLGAFPLPVEVTPFAWQVTKRQLEKLGCTASPRLENDRLFVTDNKNYILDCRFRAIPFPGKLSAAINNIPGVVENGLFTDMAEKILTVNESGEIVIIE